MLCEFHHGYLNLVLRKTNGKEMFAGLIFKRIKNLTGHGHHAGEKINI